MNLTPIDYKYIGIAITYTAILVGFNRYKQYLMNQSSTDKTNKINKTMGYIFTSSTATKHQSHGCVDSSYGCCPDGKTIAMDASMSNCHTKKKKHNDITEQSILINLVVYFSILMLWFFDNQAKSVGYNLLVKTIINVAVTCGSVIIVAYLGYIGIDHILERSNNKTNTPTKNFCDDPCNLYNKDQCTKYIAWNGSACVWNAVGNGICQSPTPNYWTRNILKATAVFLTIVILFLLFAQRKSIQNILKNDPNLSWILNINEAIDKSKQNLNITASTTWILLIIEIIILAMYCFSNYAAHRAYQKDGLVIYHPPIGTSFKTAVGCQVLNELNEFASANDSYYGNIDGCSNLIKDTSYNLLTMNKGSISNIFAVDNSINLLNFDGSNNPFPSKTLSVNIDTLKRLGYSTSSIKSLNDTNYNYGISFWFYIDPHQPGNGYNVWYNLFNYSSKPTVQYNAKSNSLRMITIAQSTTDASYNLFASMIDNASVKMTRNIKDVPLQKWNHIFINNMGGTVDLFLNSELVGNIAQVIPNSTTDYIYIGENNGIVGRICNVVYFKNTLSKIQINDIYHKYKQFNPPLL